MKLVSIFTLVIAGLFLADARPNEELNHHAPGGFVDCSNPLNALTLHPHPFRCHLYIRCQHGRPQVVPCPPDQQFSFFFKRCTSSHLSGCKEFPDFPDLSTTEEPWTTEPSTTLVPELFGICAAEPLRSFLSADPSNCKNYVVCSNGEAQVQSCDHGEYFDASTLQCLQGSCDA